MSTPNDPDVEKFLNAKTIERLQMATDDSVAPQLQTYLGQSAYDELRTLAADALKVTKTHLGINIPPNLIFVPGVMGSLLFSSKKGGVWWIDARTRHHIKDLKLAPGGKDDADPTVGITPFTVDIVYEPFFTAVIKREDFNHEIFSYDWRKPLEMSVGALRDKVNETYANNNKKPVHLVGHSMGGLMIRAALMKHGSEIWPKIDRIVFIGTPHYGCPAIAGYLKNHFWGFELLAALGFYLDRDTFRSLWGVLSLLPAPRGIYPGTRSGDPAPWTGGEDGDPYGHPCSNFDMYQASEWNLKLSEPQTDQLQKALDATAKFHQDLYNSHRALPQEQRNRMAVIAGVGYETLFRLAYQERLLGLWTSMDKVKSRVPDDPHRDGDGRVPVASAALEDVGAIRYVKGVHLPLPMTQPVYEDVFRWLKKEPMLLDRKPNGALESHLAGGASKSDAPHLTQSIMVNAVTGDPGYLDLNTPPLTEPQAANIELLLEKEQLPEFNRIRLL